MLTAAWLIGLAASTPSQTAITTLSLDEAIRRSLSKSNDIRIARNELKSARASVGVQAAKGNLQAGVSGSASRYDNKTSLTLGQSSFEVVPIHQEQLTAQLSQLIDVTGQVSAAVSQSRLNSYAAEYNLRARTSEQILTTTTQYYTVLRAAQSVNVAKAALDSYEEQLRTTTALWKQGVGLRLDVDRASSQVADAERELLGRQNDLKEAQSALNDSIGISLDSTENLEDADAEQAKAPVSMDRTDLIRQALTRRSEVLEADVSVEAAKKGIKLARADAEPIVNLGLSGNYFPTTSFQNPRHSNVGLMLSVSFAVLDGGQSRNLVDQARAQVDTAKAQEDQIKRTVSLQVQNAALDVETARKRLDAAQTSLVAAQEARKLAQQRYSAQVAQYLEVTDAQAALTSAQAAQVNALYDLLTAQARLNRVTGALDSTESAARKS